MCRSLPPPKKTTALHCLQIVFVDGFEFDELSSHWIAPCVSGMSWGIAPSTPSRSQELWCPPEAVVVKLAQASGEKLVS